MRPTLLGQRWMISAGHALVAQVAAEVLDAGGTAIDAGVAGGIACSAIQPDMCNFGGVAPITLRQAGSDEVWSVSGVGTWGSEATLERYRERYGDDMPLGHAVAVVPAAPHAWIAALRRFGTWSFRDVAAPAIRIAGEGFPLDRRNAEALEIWAVPGTGIVSILRKEPAGLCMGRVELEDGRHVPGVLGEPWRVAGQREITRWGGWRAYIAAKDAPGGG